MSAITRLYAGIPVADLEVSIDWYTRLIGRDPDFRAGNEILWQIAPSGTLFIGSDASRAGTGRITLSVTGLDALLESLAVRGIEHEAVGTYSNGVRHVKIPILMATRSPSPSRPMPSSEARRSDADARAGG